ncbi:Oxoglutarate/iron-dependent dioxygenase [Penicillium cf. griseofulvum]|uniref:Oxoglutarate/iron-dependent dioxygenase n=1 Tax=Penicillium cf. griseofulvum TaxID=2972120 RepID=A0A9W9M466_9EURO|nr:Oxoglutarate/iron-dependent dioxygenase [Penicillium cf. griseofulvum]KAJ5434285.1 Oxoglutarate/iron-dependent dioxygenase [Penicillium cf. griseofulvum]KAJ5452116.1 Oxoglutarate/iron-dependent dioxygenase [Penicillium cf. griseofulvum]
MTTLLEYTQVELLTLSGPEFRRVSTAPPRQPTDDEIPIIDIGSIDKDLEARKTIASKVRIAAENTGFFYIKNHGISEELIQKALSQAKAFFDQPIEKKQLASSNNDGWHGLGSSQINKTETRDRKETFSLRYNLSNDPTISDPETLTTDNDFSWETTSHLPGFQETTIEFFKSRLTLARKIIRIFALALGMPENYFDDVMTNPGADGLYTHYPATPVDTLENNGDVDVGIGSHTDIQCVTLLWQDMSGGLQVLSGSDEWLDAQPIPGTIVVNIGDLLQRLSNNRFKSTVHRVYNRQPTSRYSMPFFLGFNPDSVCQVVPSCIDESHPALYGPISCGKWHRNRLELAHGKPISP